MKKNDTHDSMKENDKSPQELSLADLAKALDNQGIGDLTRAFVKDLRGGIVHATPEHFPWMKDLEKTEWSGILCLGMGGSAAGGDFIAAFQVSKELYPLSYNAIMFYRHGGTQIGWSFLHLTVATQKKHLKQLKLH